MKKNPIPARIQQVQKKKALKELTKVITHSNALFNVSTKDKIKTVSGQVKEPCKTKSNPKLIDSKPRNCKTSIPDSKGLLQRLAVFSAML